MTSPADYERDALHKAQVDIAVLQMTVRAMLVFFTESKDGRAYDRDKIKNLRNAIIKTFSDPHPDDPNNGMYSLLQENLKSSIDDIFINLIED